MARLRRHGNLEKIGGQLDKNQLFHQIREDNDYGRMTDKKWCKRGEWRCKRCGGPSWVMWGKRCASVWLDSANKETKDLRTKLTLDHSSAIDDDGVPVKVWVEICSSVRGFRCTNSVRISSTFRLMSTRWCCERLTRWCTVDWFEIVEASLALN
jgi:hypothetical protein